MNTATTATIGGEEKGETKMEARWKDHLQVKVGTVEEDGQLYAAMQVGPLTREVAENMLSAWIKDLDAMNWDLAGGGQ